MQSNIKQLYIVNSQTSSKFTPGSISPIGNIQTSSGARFSPVVPVQKKQKLSPLSVNVHSALRAPVKISFKGNNRKFSSMSSLDNVFNKIRGLR